MENLPALRIDFDLSTVENVFDTESLAFILGWPIESVEQSVRHLPIFRDIPLTCRKAECVCLKRALLSEEMQKRVEGKRCPIEINYAKEIFTGYIKDLDIQPQHYTDVQMVTDIVRIQVILRRIDQDLAEKGMYSEEVGGIIQKEGMPVWQKIEHRLLQAQSRLRKDLDAKYQQLMASREAKAKQAERITRIQQSSADLFSKLRQAINEEAEEQKNALLEANEEQE